MPKDFDQILADFPQFHTTPRPPERIPEILAALQDAWELNPDARFFQLLWNIFQTDESLATLHAMEDWQVSDRLAEHLNERTKNNGS